MPLPFLYPFQCRQSPIACPLAQASTSPLLCSSAGSCLFIPPLPNPCGGLLYCPSPPPSNPHPTILHPTSTSWNVLPASPVQFSAANKGEVWALQHGGGSAIKAASSQGRMPGPQGLGQQGRGRGNKGTKARWDCEGLAGGGGGGLFLTAPLLGGRSWRCRPHAPCSAAAAATRRL